MGFIPPTPPAPIPPMAPIPGKPPPMGPPNPAMAAIGPSPGGPPIMPGNRAPGPTMLGDIIGPPPPPPIGPLIMPLIMLPIGFMAEVPCGEEAMGDGPAMVTYPANFIPGGG